jgi:hypothetical protein
LYRLFHDSELLIFHQFFFFDSFLLKLKPGIQRASKFCFYDFQIRFEKNLSKLGHPNFNPIYLGQLIDWITRMHKKKSWLSHLKNLDPHNPENWTGSVQFLDCLTNQNNTKIDSQNYWLDCHSLEIGLGQSNFLDRVSQIFLNEGV